MTRIARNTARAAPAVADVPADVRLMNAVAIGVFVLAAGVLMAAGVTALARLPAFSLRMVRIDGDLARSNLATLRANALPRLHGNFFSMDLKAARAAFESVPWVRRAVVRRLWPDTLLVTLVEQQPAAVWEGADDDGGNDRLVNTDGEVFEANLGDVEDEELPSFTGPEGSAARMLALYRRLGPVFAPIGAEPRALALSGRGSWRLELAGGASVELGRSPPDGPADELVARAERYVRTVGEVRERFQNRPVEYADLRHADGYAVRIRGVSTTVPPAASPKR